MKKIFKKTNCRAIVQGVAKCFRAFRGLRPATRRNARKYFAAPWNDCVPKQFVHGGFTLLETLFSILIFSAALVALMTIAARGISATQAAQQETVAHYLAQEGLEVARNIRDTNYLSGGANLWDAGFSSCVAPGGCMVVYGSSNPTLALNNCLALGTNLPTACLVYQNTSSGMFTDQASGGIASGFTRSVVVAPATSSQGATADEYTVTSTVGWKFKTIPRTVSLTTILKKWQ